MYKAAPAQEASPTAEPSRAPDTEATSTPGLSQAPLTQEAIGEALRIATLHGLTEDDLRGEYALFSEFTPTLFQSPPDAHHLRRENDFWRLCDLDGSRHGKDRTRNDKCGI